MSNQKTEKKPAKKTGLGRGLGSLLGENIRPSSSSGPDEVELPTDDFEFYKSKSLQSGFVEEKTKQKTEIKVPDAMRIWNLSIDKLKGNSKQPRKHFDTAALKELSDSIKQKGILQPIVVRKKSEDHFEIIAGERRWRAAQQAGLHEVPVILKAVNDQETLELALIENIQRKDLNPMEEAEAYSYLMKAYDLTQQQVADKVGKERVTVANSLRILNLVPEVRNLVLAEKLSIGQAKALLTVPDHQLQRKIALKAVKDSLTVKEIERFCKSPQLLNGPQVKNSSNDSMSEKLVKGVASELQKLMGTKVQIKYNGGKGQLKINFYSDDELNQLVENMRNACQK